MRVSGGEGEVTAFGEQKCCNQPQCGGREAAWRLRQGRRILRGDRRGQGRTALEGGLARALDIPPEKGTGGARSVAWAAGRKRV